MVALTDFSRWVGGLPGSWLLIAPILLLVAVGSFFEVSDKFMERSYSYKIVSVGLDKQTYRQGETMRTRVVVNRNMPDRCAITIHRFFTHNDDGNAGVVAWSQIVPGIITKGNNRFVSREIEPPKLAIGKYHYQYYAIEDCGSFGLTTISPQVAFEIVP